MIPKVKRYGDIEVEPFEDYVSRWPKELCNFPVSVIEDWVYLHNPQFIGMWAPLRPELWTFSLREMSNEEIMSIQHLDGELEHYDYVGNKLLGTTDPYQRLAQYMGKNGTYPVSIIVAVNAEGIQHPKGRAGELMKTPLQLIEGHRRLGLLREMNRREWPALRPTHDVWALSFSTLSGGHEWLGKS